MGHPGLRRVHRPRPAGPGGRRAGQRSLVGRASGQPGDRGHLDEHRRDHEAGQPVSQEIAQADGRPCLDRRWLAADEIGDQLPVTRAELPRRDRGVGDPVVPGQSALGLGRIDPVAVHLELPVDPAQHLEAVLGVPAPVVAGAVHPGSGLGAVRIGQEPHRRAVPGRPGSRGPHRNLRCRPRRSGRAGAGPGPVRGPATGRAGARCPPARDRSGPGRPEHRPRRIGTT